jgi:hypothetical protein
VSMERQQETNSVLFSVTELLDGEYADYVKECNDFVMDDGSKVPCDMLLGKLRQLSKIGDENKEALYVFWETIVPVVDGIHNWTRKKKFPLSARPSVAFSVSDEAFAMVVIENNFLRWVDEHRKLKNGVKPRSKLKKKSIEGKGVEGSGEEGSDEPISTIKPLYTEESGTKGGKGGWSEIGMAAFNKMFQTVLEDRNQKVRKDMEDEFVAKLFARGSGGIFMENTMNQDDYSAGPKRSLETSMFASLLAMEDEKEAHEGKRVLLDHSNHMQI